MAEPKLKEKKACPMAASKTDPSILEKSGLNIKVKPFMAPSKVSERMAKAIKPKNKIGIIILDAFSKPFCTPPAKNNPVKNIKTNCQITGS